MSGRGKDDWYKREPRAILDACRGKGVDFIAIYNTILDLIYERGGGCPNDPVWIAGWVGCDRRKVSFHIEKLIEAGKLRVDELGELRNPKADEVLRRRLTPSEGGGSARGRPEVGRESARGRASVTTANIAKNNDLPKQSQRETQKEKENLNTESSSPDSTLSNTNPNFTNPPVSPQGGKAPNEGKKSSSSKRTLIGDWVPTDDDKRKAVKYWRTHGREDLVQRGRQIVDQFLANHRSRGTRMLDWPAAWQTWYTRELATAPLRGTGQPAAISRNYRADAEGYEVMRDEDWLLALRMFYGLDGGEAGVWLRDRRGPAPGEPGCRVKQDLIDKVKPRNAA